MKQALSALILTFTCLVVLLVFPSNTVAQNEAKLVGSAYDRIKELVDSKTFMVVRIDLTTVDAETLAQSLESLFANFLKESKYDSDKFKSARREFHIAVDGIKENINEINALQKAVGLREAFIVLQTPRDGSVRVFFPGLKETLHFLTGFEEVSPHSNNGLLLVTDAAEDAEVYQNFVPADNAGLRSFYQKEATGDVQFYFSNLKLDEVHSLVHKLKSSEIIPTFEISDEAKAGSNALSSFLQNAYFCLDLNKLTLHGSLVFTTAERAEAARKGIEVFLNQMLDEMRKNKSQTAFGFSKEISDKYNLSSLEFAMTRAAAQKMLVPQRSANILYYEFTPNSERFWSNTSVLFLPLLMSK